METIKDTLLLHNENAMYMEEDSEALLYFIEDENDIDNTIILNQMGRIIWKLCDGTRTLNDLVDMFGSHFPDEDIAKMREDIRGIIDLLLDTSFLVGRE